MTDKKKILIIDDEANLREIISEYLEDQYTIEMASDGLEGLEKIKSFSPDLILSDITMPKLDGLGFLERARAEGVKTPVIIISGFGDVKTIKMAWNLGAFDFLDKPIDFAVLQSTVHLALTFGAAGAKTRTQVTTLSLALNADVVQKFAVFCKERKISVDQEIERWMLGQIENDLKKKVA